jgi:hypothetical protein
VHPFDLTDWEIKNADQSLVITLFVAFLYPWGMPLFFLIAGAGTWFALRRRTARQYAVERVKRLLVPFVVGSAILSPLQLYLEWRHTVQVGVFDGPLVAFVRARPISIGPRVFGWAGYHLWFLGFLFAFSLIALPLFQWLKSSAGRRISGCLARLAASRGGMLLFVVPLTLVRFALQPFFPDEHDWSDFVFAFLFSVYGYILFSDDGFRSAIRRSWRAALALGVASYVFLVGAFAADKLMTWMVSPNTLWFYISWLVFSVNSWCWSLFVLYIGMRFLDRRTPFVDYGQRAVVPFFLLHQPVIIAIAYFVVQWDASVLVKLSIVVLGSFAITTGLYELVIRRARPLRGLLGMKA